MPKLSTEKLAARRRQILDAAATCFARDGFHRTSMQDIVKECGVSAGLVYRYFASKDDMIEAIVTDWQDQRRARLHAGPPLDAYLALLRSLGEPGAVGGGAADVSTAVATGWHHARHEAEGRRRGGGARPAPRRRLHR